MNRVAVLGLVEELVAQPCKPPEQERRSAGENPADPPSECLNEGARAHHFALLAFDPRTFCPAFEGLH
jgi:hypothetical protein